MKQKWGMKKMLLLWVPILAVLLALIIAVTVVANVFAVTLDTYVGKGTAELMMPTDENGDPIKMDADFYELKYDGTLEARAASEKVAEAIADEGIVLLKNNGTLPIAKNSNITALGRGYVEPMFGGTGSGNMPLDGCVTPNDALTAVFGVNQSAFEVLTDEIPNVKRGEPGAQPMESTNTYWIGEFPKATYESLDFDGYTDAAVVFISRKGSEGGDLSMNLKKDIADHATYNGPFAEPHPETANYTDDQHQLELSKEEKDMLDVAKANFEKVIVVVSSSNIMEMGTLELDEEIDGIIWMGGPGARGNVSLAKILCGDVSPSGKTVDTWSADFTRDPSFANFSRNGTREYSNIEASNGSQNSFVEYEEGIYVGYKYFETMYSELGEGGDAWYDAWRTAEDADGTGIVYPFGHGLSYASFEQSFVGSPSVTNGHVTVTVNVENTHASRAGKDAVQLYFDPPYTDMDRTMHIEKATKNLVAFGKTGEILAGDSITVTLGFDLEDMASYCTTVENSDGTKGGYMLEKGEYTLYLGKNAHDSYATATVTVPETIWYTGDNLRESDRIAQSYMNDDGTYQDIPKAAMGDSSAKFVAAHNLFDDMTDYMRGEGKTPLTRASGFTVWQATTPEGDDLIAPQYVVEEHEFKDYASGKYADRSITEKPVMGADNGLKLSDLRGKDYYDPLWDDLLDQLTEEDYNNEASLMGSYGFTPIDSVGKPQNFDSDGPQGLKGPFMFGTVVPETPPEDHGTSWPTEPIVAATFNVDLAREYGVSLGHEAIYTEFVGWYAPGLNIHRSPFAGRNYEYYSEDSLISGLMGANVVEGASSMGTVCYIKHYMLNEQESDRMGSSSWCDEQTLRENYLKAFELAVKLPVVTVRYTDVKTGKVAEKQMRSSIALMSSFNRAGATWVGGSKAAITGVLRTEWGFRGTVITDYNAMSAFMYPDQARYAGGDQILGIPGFTEGQMDKTSPSALWSLRNAFKNFFYAVAHSNIMNGVPAGAAYVYSMSPWAIGLLVANIGVYAFILGMIAYLVIRFVREKGRLTAA